MRSHHLFRDGRQGPLPSSRLGPAPAVSACRRPPLVRKLLPRPAPRRAACWPKARALCIRLAPPESASGVAGVADVAAAVGAGGGNIVGRYRFIRVDRGFAAAAAAKVAAAAASKVAAAAHLALAG